MSTGKKSLSRSDIGNLAYAVPVPCIVPRVINFTRLAVGAKPAVQASAVEVYARAAFDDVLSTSSVFGRANHQCGCPGARAVGRQNGTIGFLILRPARRRRTGDVATLDPIVCCEDRLYTLTVPSHCMSQQSSKFNLITLA